MHVHGAIWWLLTISRRRMHHSLRFHGRVRRWLHSVAHGVRVTAGIRLHSLHFVSHVITTTRCMRCTACKRMGQIGLGREMTGVAMRTLWHIEVIVMTILDFVREIGAEVDDITQISSVLVDPLDSCIGNVDRVVVNEGVARNGAQVKIDIVFLDGAISNGAVLREDLLQKHLVQLHIECVDLKADMQLKPDTAIQRRTSLLVCGGNVHSDKSRYLIRHDEAGTNTVR